jgi:DNA-binding NtrC family response regulator
MEINEKQARDIQIKHPLDMQYPIIGKSRAVDQLIKHIYRLSKLRNDVIIIGEAGVGKGAVAKNIYSMDMSPDNKRPFLAINLSVIDDKELESTLLGTSSSSLFDTMQNGTILIEDIEESSFRNQMKILNFINDRNSRQIPSAEFTPLDLRFIVTVKDSLHTLLERRKILEELFYKMDNFERITVPPLRDRPEDIPLMVKHFSTELCKELGISELTIDINAIEVLVRQTWRENIRELKAIVDKSVLFSSGGRFSLPPELVDEKTEIVKMINNIEEGQDFVLDNSLDVIEKGIIERSLQKFGFNQSKAAGFLGMTEQTLRYKLKRLGIVSSRQR